MAILEELLKQTTTEDGQRPDVATDDIPLPSKKVTVIDGMAVGNFAWLKTWCRVGGPLVTTTLDSKTKDCDEVHLGV